MLPALNLDEECIEKQIGSYTVSRAMSSLFASGSWYRQNLVCQYSFIIFECPSFETTGFSKLFQAYRIQLEEGLLFYV